MYRHPDHLVVERVEGETLIYDVATDHAHALDARAASIWIAADGAVSADAIAVSTGVEAEIVRHTVSELAGLGLLTTSAPGFTRREHLGRVALAGAAAAAAVPVIKTIVAPTAAQASTLGATGTSCTSSMQCQSGTCDTANGICL